MMPNPSDLTEHKSLEKREIRGLTLESLIKYGSIIVSMIIGFYLIKSKVDQNAIAIEKIENKIKVLEINQTTDEIWKARIEEKLKK